jgi:hypothetical protein
MPTERWFALIGRIDGHPSTTFLIGTGRKPILMPASGELICFANDVPGYYWNNLGTLQLTITRCT